MHRRARGAPQLRTRRRSSPCGDQRRSRAAGGAPESRLPCPARRRSRRRDRSDEEAHQRMGRSLLDVRGITLVVPEETVARRTELEGDRWDQDHRRRTRARRAAVGERGSSRPRSRVERAARPPSPPVNRSFPRMPSRARSQREAAGDERADERGSSLAHHPRGDNSGGASAGRRGRAEDGRDAGPRPARGGPRGRRRRTRRGRALDGPRDRLRRDRPRRDAAGRRRVRDLPRAARRRSLVAGADAHRARRRRRPGRQASTSARTTT